jgi:hypothetical protein
MVASITEALFLAFSIVICGAIGGGAGCVPVLLIASARDYRATPGSLSISSLGLTLPPHLALMVIAAFVASYTTGALRLIMNYHLQFKT